MRDFELNFLFNRRQHPLTLRHNKAIHNSVFPRSVESKAGRKTIRDRRVTSAVIAVEQRSILLAFGI
jgi:hypothetical protein